MTTSVDEIKQPAVFFANGIGDAILNLPAIRALCQAFSGNATLVCTDGGEAFLFDCLKCRQVRVSISRDRNFRAQAVYDKIAHCDALISLVPWDSPALRDLVKMFGCLPSIGFGSHFSNGLRLDFSCHSAELSFRVVRMFRPDWSLTKFIHPPSLPAEYTAKARSLLTAAGFTTRILCVHTDTQAQKMWPVDRWVEVLDRFLMTHADFLALIVGLPDLALESGRQANNIVLCQGIHLAYSFSIASQADLFVGVDSCMLHFADACGVPSVGLFGPTKSYEFGFLFATNETVEAAAEMQEITVEQVYSALKNVESKSDYRGIPRRHSWRT